MLHQQICQVEMACNAEIYFPIFVKSTIASGGGAERYFFPPQKSVLFYNYCTDIEEKAISITYLYQKIAQYTPILEQMSVIVLCRQYISILYSFYLTINEQNFVVFSMLAKVFFEN